MADGSVKVLVTSKCTTPFDLAGVARRAELVETDLAGWPGGPSWSRPTCRSWRCTASRRCAGCCATWGGVLRPLPPVHVAGGALPRGVRRPRLHLGGEPGLRRRAPRRLAFVAQPG
ncbi:MAG: hypothetical protein ACYCUG_14470 [Acidimicrobiales bacterium]